MGNVHGSILLEKIVRSTGPLFDGRGGTVDEHAVPVKLHLIFSGGDICKLVIFIIEDRVASEVAPQGLIPVSHPLKRHIAEICGPDHNDGEV